MSVCVLQNLEKYRVLWTDFLASCWEINRFSVSKIGPEPAKPTISLALLWTSGWKQYFINPIRQLLNPKNFIQCQKIYALFPNVCLLILLPFLSIGYWLQREIFAANIASRGFLNAKTSLGNLQPAKCLPQIITSSWYFRFSVDLMVNGIPE